MHGLPAAFLEPRILELRLPRRSAGTAACTLQLACIEDVQRRRPAAESDEEPDSSDEEGDTAQASARVQTIRVRLLPAAGGMGGKVWDSSPLMAAWLCESGEHLPPCSEGGACPPRLLELGAGLGVAGLAVAKAFGHLDMTLSDYDPVVLNNLHENLRLTMRDSADHKGNVSITSVDFRDFTPETIRCPEAMQKYDELGLYHGVDMIIGADVVYDSCHCQLAQVCLALLATASGCCRWQPCAVFMLPDGRPRLREFVQQLHDAGLTCRIERVMPSCATVRRLRRSVEGWGAGASFSLYFVTRGDEEG